MDPTEDRGVLSTTSQDVLSWLLQKELDPKTPEEALRHSEAMYRNLVEQIPAITYIAEPTVSSTAYYVSPQVEPITGFRPEEWCVKPSRWRLQVHPEDLQRILGELKRSLAGDVPFVSEYRFFKKGGELIWIRDQGRAVRDVCTRHPSSVHRISPRCAG